MSVPISLYVIAAALLGAHFSRAHNFLLLAICLAMPLLLLYQRRWVVMLLQIAAYLGAASWVWTALQIVQSRQQIGRPWTAAALILGAVAVFTLVAGLLLNARPMRERYR